MSKKQTLARRALARKRFAAFVAQTYPGYHWNWHHRLLAKYLEAWANHEIPRLIVSMRPRAGKTELASRRLPAWLLGRRPDAQIISASYGQSLSSEIAREVKKIMKDEEYREVFPDLRFDVDQAAKFTTSDGGVYLATSVGGSMTGYGANYLIIDDPVRGREDAESQAVRDKTWAWFNNDAMTRLVYPASVLVMATRWHMDDLTGRILASPGAKDWTVLNLPAIAPEDPPDYDPRSPGEPLWPEFYTGLGRTDVPREESVEKALEVYEDMRENDAYMFSALYQGQPTPSEGTTFKRRWFGHEYTADPAHRGKLCEEVLISVDSTFGRSKRSDYVELLVLGRKGRFIFVLDEINRRMDFPSTISALLDLRARWPNAGVLVEAKANGQAVIDTLKAKIGGVIGFNPDKYGSKEARANIAAQRLEAGDVLFPTAVNAPWKAEFIEDFVGFGSRPHDDRIDALSMACLRWNSSSTTRDLAAVNDGLSRLVDSLRAESSFGRLF